MKKVLLSGLFAVIAGTAVASDGGMFGDYRYTRAVRVEPRAVAYVPAQPMRAVQAAPCARNCGTPISVKTHTEVIDHYQMYQPVTVYQPAGTYAQRRIVQNAQPCQRANRCGY